MGQHKYNALLIFAVPIFCFSSYIIVCEQHEQTVEISILAGRHWERSAFFCAIFAFASRTVAAALEHNCIQGFVERPVRGSLQMASCVFARGFMSAFLTLSAFSAVFSLLSYRENMQKNSGKNGKESQDFIDLLMLITAQSCDIASSLFFTSFPLFFAGSLAGAPVFILLNRAHWAEQLRRGASVISRL